MLAAMVALVAVVAIPAALAQNLGRFNNDSFQERFGNFFGEDFFNQFGDNSDNGFDSNGAGGSQEFDQSIGDTSDVNLSLEVGSSGNNSNQCVVLMQFGNTGNLQNSQ